MDKAAWEQVGGFKVYTSLDQIGKDAFDGLAKWAGRVTETAYVCGSGPSLTGALAKIPQDKFSIALNGAAVMNYPFTAWTVFDQLAMYWHWYADAKISPDTLVLFGNSLVDPRADYYYQVDSTSGIGIYPDRVCGTCTVAGCAISLVYAAQQFNGYKNPRIVLAGVDMKGSGHASGETGMQVGTWQQRDTLLQLIRVVEARGTTVQTLTETELHLDVVDGQ